MINFLLVACVLVTVLSAIPVVLQMRNQPRGLIVCFFTEMWERFSYYGMRALLIYYLTQHFLFSDKHATEQYASYTALVYLTPLIGGLVADRWLGTRKAVIFGAVLLCLGHLGMAFEGKPAEQILTHAGQTYSFVSEGRQAQREVRLQVGDASYDWQATPDGGLTIAGLPADAPLPATLPPGSFELTVANPTPWAEQAYYLAVSLIILGVGFLKPNISTIVGQLYDGRDPRRDSGFQLYYYGINLGSFWSALLCGYVGQTVGWWAGFGLAGIGMVAGLAVFILGKSWLDGRGAPPEPEKLTEKVAGLPRETVVYALSLLGLPLVFYLIQRHAIVGLAELTGVVIVLGYVVFRMITRYSREENYRLALAMVLSLCSVAFWALFEQAGSSLNLFAARNVDLQFLDDAKTIALFGHTYVLASAAQLEALGGLPAGTVWIDMGLTGSQTQSFGPGFILLGAPVMAFVLAWLGRRHLDPPPLRKFAFALACAGGGFLMLTLGANWIDASFRVPWYFLLLTYMFHAIGELALSPVGLSQQTKLSPVTLVSTMMAIWFLGTSGAQYVAGMIANTAASQTVGGQVVDAQASLDASIATFTTIGLWGLGLAVGVFVLSYFISHWAGEDARAR
ncbi:inner membrane transporter ybgH [Asticcacaulis biprosthecium C19]|uniref:Inner membrane transporter ybgH n=1 Tax=Asticcacaulis biprosthecium C19 TaxID=715226 RepID=F4QI70_9CAUL|nr:oligopeptide:H+ symporter [Asticcacaulis biprosthecium]EGF91708.1 inner membrane transporter ybgH [Asticcacaulis biprosthecium C19]